VPPTKLKALANPYDKSQPLDARAKAYLHANCSVCHVEAGGGNSAMQLDFPTEWAKMRLIDVKPLHQTFDLKDAKLIAPGDPDRSVLIQRVSKRGPNTGQMPPLATSRVDTAGVDMLREWCRGLKK
jgi:hypothetical protein